MTLSKESAVLVGSDEHTEWLIPWFIDNFRKHNPDRNIIFADFGMKNKIQENVFEDFIKLTNKGHLGWFNKPLALKESLSMYRKVVWMDLDCQVLGSLNELFDGLETGKMSIAEDRPWTKRRGSKWFNTGVVGIKYHSELLDMWIDMTRDFVEHEKRDVDKPFVPSMFGDQDILHSVLSKVNELDYIKQLDNKWNCLRLQVEHDNEDVEDKRVMHWTGQKGNLTIREMVDKNL